MAVNATASSSRAPPRITLAVLALVIERPSYIYEIARRAESLGIGKSSVYDAMKRLYDRGFVEVSHAGGTDRQPKVHYRPTQAGIDYHRTQAAQTFAATRSHMDLRAALLRGANDPPALLALLNAYEQQILDASAKVRPVPATAPLRDRLAALHEQMTLTAEADFVKHGRKLVEDAP